MTGMAYMCKNRHGTYYARFIIPKPLQTHFKNKKEIRRSLQTDSRKLATKRARAYRVQFESIVEKLMSKDSNTVDMKFITFIDSFGKTVTIDSGDVEQDINIYKEIAPKPSDELLALREKRAEELHQAQLAAITIAPALSAPAQPTPTSETVSKCFDDYIAHKLTPGKKGSWSEGTARQKPNKLKTFLTIFGDKPAGNLTRDDMYHYIEVAYKIPANFENTSYKKFKGITVEMVLTNAPEVAALDYETRSVGTIKDDLKTVRAALNWVLKRKDISSLQPAINALDNETGDIDYESSRVAFTDAELKTLFEQDNPASENYIKGFSNPINYWLPLIALYTGARLAEICQLHLSDIKQEKAIASGNSHWCIDINDDDDKKLKSKNSKRQIPIHRNLINTGLLNYVDELIAKGETKLFPNAARNSDQFGKQSQWFGAYSSGAGVAGKNTTFHSFRHCFCSHLAESHTPEDIVTALSGHQYNSLAKSTYDRSRKRDVGKLAEVIDSIDYGLTHPPFKTDQ